MTETLIGSKKGHKESLSYRGKSY